MLNQNVPQRVNILHKIVVNTQLQKELLSASKDCNIIANDKTLLQGGNNLVDFQAIKRDLLSGENSSKISNNPPVVWANISVVQKHYDENISILVRLG